MSRRAADAFEEIRLNLRRIRIAEGKPDPVPPQTQNDREADTQPPPEDD
jgi:hypothetical protein